MAMNAPLIAPALDQAEVQTRRWMVVIHNNDITPFDLVILTLMQATGCDLEEASMEAWEAHHFGKAPVHFSSETQCHQIAQMIEQVGVKTSVSPEWDD